MINNRLSSRVYRRTVTHQEPKIAILVLVISVRIKRSGTVDRFADLCITEQERLKAPHLSTISVMIVTVPLLSVKVPVEIELEYHVRSRSPIFRIFPPPLSFSLPFPSMLVNNNLETSIIELTRWFISRISN